VNEDQPRFTAPPVEKSVRLDPSIADRVAIAVANRKPVPANVRERREQNNRARLSKGDPIG
jgi:hypothetical protein